MTEPTLNPYAAPQARVADVNAEAGLGELKLFSAKGRIGRLRLLAYLMGAYLLFAVAFGVLAAALSGSQTAAGLVAIPAFLVYLWFIVISSIKRCHDADQSGWWAITFFIPLIGLIWFFWPGSQGANRFGAPPPANTFGIKLLGLLLPVIAVIGILAAIAIPAYQGYVEKARAAQTSGR